MTDLSMTTARGNSNTEITSSSSSSNNINNDGGKSIVVEIPETDPAERRKKLLNTLHGFRK